MGDPLVAQPRRETVYGWLRVVACYEALRLLAREHEALSADDEALGAAVEAARPLAQPCPEDRDRALAALEAIAQLPAGVCGAFALHAGGHSYREIAERLAVSQRAVDRRLRRARERIGHLAET